ncbi:hypothetical protein [Sutterella sp.]|uniref:hypothetical protein n=1 Tax=Sutterella sp. TaxID=1981025 RepID=UPI003FD71D72
MVNQNSLSLTVCAERLAALQGHLANPTTSSAQVLMAISQEAHALNRVLFDRFLMGGGDAETVRLMNAAGVLSHRARLLARETK